MKSIGAEFLLTIGLVAMLFCGFAFYRAYAGSRTHAERLVRQQVSLPLDFGLVIRPRMQSLLPEDGSEPGTMSTSFVARSALERVRWKTSWRR